MNISFTLRLSEEDHAWLEEEAERLGLSKTDIVRHMIRTSRAQNNNAKQLLDVIESSLELRVQLRRLVFVNPHA